MALETAGAGADVGVDDERRENGNASVGAASPRHGLTAEPTHLVVLVHGLHGTPEDLSYLKEALERSGGAEILVHLAKCNRNKTLDGVAEGGERLAREVLQVVRSTPSLRSISLVGNSLGGLYARYAAKLLYREEDGADGADGASFTASASAMSRKFTRALQEAEQARASVARATGSSASRLGGGEILRLTEGISSGNAPVAGAADDAGESHVGGGVVGTIAGLRPAVFMSIAAPHLGVRRFTYIPLPSPLHGLATVLVGKTGSDLFLNRHKGEQSSVERTVSAPKMIAAAAAVTTAVAQTLAGKRSDAGANGQPVGTGEALASTARGGRGGQGEAPLLYRMATSEEFLKPLKAFRSRRAYANRRGDFMVPYETAAFIAPDEGDRAEGAPEESKSFGIADQVLGASRGAIVGTTIVGTSVLARSRSSSRSLLEAVFGSEEKKEGDMEGEMAAGLNSCGWQKVSVDFGGLLPFSHNKICALSRTPVATALWSAGRNIMDHAADFVSRYPEVDVDGEGEIVIGESKR